MLLPWLAIFDFLSIRANFKQPVDIYETKKRSNDFALLVPIFNDVKYLSNVDFLRKYAKNVVLCTTDQETPEFREALEKIASENGFRISYAPVEGKGKNPWAIYSKTLLAHDAVLKVTTHRLSEKYVIFIDGDTYVDGDLSILCGAMDENEFDLASVRVIPSRRETIMERLQGIEYDIAMRGRFLYPWLTSGAGMIARAEVMKAVFENHSLFFNGGDIEIGKLADMMGFRVGHIPMVFYTDVPPTFIRWMNQRKSWMCGKFRHSIVNIHHNLNYPFHFLYYSLVLYFLYPFKVLEAISHPYLLPLIIVFYIIVTFVANWRVRSKWMVIYPLYAFFQVMIGIWQGVWRYIITVRRTGNFGRIRIDRSPNCLRRADPRRLLKQCVNLSIIVLTTLVIAFGTIEPIQQLFIGRAYPFLNMLADGIAHLRALMEILQPLLRQNMPVGGLMPILATFTFVVIVVLAVSAYHALHQVQNRLLTNRNYRQSGHSKAKRALMRVEREIELNPTDAKLFSLRAQILAVLGMHDLAVDSYLRSLELQPATAVTSATQEQDFDYRSLRADSLMAPTQSWTQSLAEAHSIRASQYLKESQLAQALDHYLCACRLSPSIANLYQVLMLQHKIDRAKAEMQKTRRSQALISAGD